MANWTYNSVDITFKDSDKAKEFCKWINSKENSEEGVLPPKVRASDNSAPLFNINIYACDNEGANFNCESKWGSIDYTMINAGRKFDFDFTLSYENENERLYGECEMKDYVFRDKWLGGNEYSKCIETDEDGDEETNYDLMYDLIRKKEFMNIRRIKK